MGSQMIIIADDLTGAGDTAIQFSKNGFDTVVLPEINQNTYKIANRYSVVAINTDTRSLSKEEAYKKVFDISSSVGMNGVFKKIDSMLRGNPGTEIKASLDALNAEVAFIAPSYPANQRIVKNGYLINGKVEFNICNLLENEIGLPIVHVPYTEIRKGSESLSQFIEREIQIKPTKFVVFDAESDQDLGLIFDAASSLGKKSIYSGSAGFANIIASKLRNGKTKTNKMMISDNTKSILVVVGSITHITVDQVSALASVFPDDIQFLKIAGLCEKNKNEIIDTMVSRCLSSLNHDKRLLVLAVDSVFNKPAKSEFESEKGKAFSKLISDALGETAYKIASKHCFSSIVATGGDTSLQVCKKFGVNGIEPQDEIAPGIPYGKVIGGITDGCSIVTKSGGFGERNTLINIINFLKGGK